MVEEAIGLVEKWYWKSDVKLTAELVVGLLLATWVQSVWPWRPMVALSGTSDSGKTTLLEVFESLFRAMALKNDRPNEAGLRQAIGRNAFACFCDEFDKSKRKQDLLDLLRTGSKGSMQLKGTLAQTGRQFALRHIVWLAGTETAIGEYADRNRFILLELFAPPQGKRGKIDLPAEWQLQDLGQRLLAIAVRHVVRACELSTAIKSMPFESVHGRMVENYSVPVAMLAAAAGATEEGAQQIMTEVFAGVTQDPGHATKDETELMGDILSCSVDLGRGDRVGVAEILADPQASTAAIAALARAGINRQATGQGSRTDLNDYGDVIFFVHKMIERNFFRGTRWEGHAIDQLLCRFPGSQKIQRRIIGHRPWGVQIPASYLLNNFLQSEDGKQF